MCLCNKGLMQECKVECEGSTNKFKVYAHEDNKGASI